MSHSPDEKRIDVNVSDSLRHADKHHANGKKIAWHLVASFVAGLSSLFVAVLESYQVGAVNRWSISALSAMSIALIFLIMLTTFFSLRARRHTSILKEQVREVYILALEFSQLNPTPGK